MTEFAAPETLSTLAAAREAYAALLASFHEREGELTRLREDLHAANGLNDEAQKQIAALNEAAKAKEAEAARDEDTQAKLTEISGIAEKRLHDLATARQTIESLETKVEQLQAEAKSAEERAAEMCASVGVEPAEVTPAGDPQAKESARERWARPFQK